MSNIIEENFVEKDGPFGEPAPGVLDGRIWVDGCVSTTSLLTWHTYMELACLQSYEFRVELPMCENNTQLSK